MNRPHDPPGPAARPMRIAAIGARGIPSNYSGIERIWANLYGLLAARGHQVTCYCRPGVIGSPLGTHNGVRLVTTNAPGGRSAETLSHTYTALRHALSRGDVHDGGAPFDLIALHALPPQMFAGMPRRRGVPLVSHVHGLDWQREKWRRTPLAVGSRVIRAAERRMVRHADAIAVCSANLVDYYRDAYGRAVHLMPNGIVPDDRPFTPDGPTLVRFGLRPGGFVACIGRLVPEKRIEDALAAFARLADRFPHHRLAIVGEAASPAYRSALESKAGDRVVFTGLLTGRALETLFRAAAAYVTASELEGLPSSLLECMEAATPAVASDIPPHRQLLGDVEGHDLLYPVGGVAALADRLARVLADPGAARVVGEAQRRYARQHYAWPLLAERIERLYADTIAARAAAPRPVAEAEFDDLDEAAAAV